MSIFRICSPSLNIALWWVNYWYWYGPVGTWKSIEEDKYDAFEVTPSHQQDHHFTCFNIYQAINLWKYWEKFGLEIVNCVDLLSTTFCLLDDKSNENEVNAIRIRRVWVDGFCISVFKTLKSK